jgi:acetyl esterase/lipase
VVSPWTDLALTGESFRLNAAIDPLVSVEPAPRVVELCLAGADPRNPYASPLYGDPTGLPPTLILVGGDDVLRDDAVRMADKMRAAGCNVEIEVWPHMWLSGRCSCASCRRQRLRSRASQRFCKTSYDEQVIRAAHIKAE